jgi:hypothetical protein
LLEPSFEHVRGLGTHQRTARKPSGFAQGGRKQKRAWLVAETGRFEVLVQELLQLVVHGKLFLLSAFLFESEKKPFSGRIIILDLQIHDGADPGESVSKDPEQSAIAEARVRGCLDHVQKLLNLTFNKCRRFAFGPRKSLGLDFPGRIHGEHSFFGQPPVYDFLAIDREWAARESETYMIGALFLLLIISTALVFGQLRELTGHAFVGSAGNGTKTSFPAEDPADENTRAGDRAVGTVTSSRYLILHSNSSSDIKVR